MKKKAFTLIELMVAIAIIGVLLAVCRPQVFRQINMENRRLRAILRGGKDGGD